MKGKKEKKEQAWIGGDCMADEGLLSALSARKLKSNVGSNFSHTVVLSPFDYVALSHLACILMPLHSFVLQLPSPSRCVWCQLDKFSFFFFSLHLEPLQDNVNCDIAVAATSPLAHTGHNPSSPPPTPVTATSTPRYLINPVAATTATMPPLAPALTCVAGHTQATPPPSLSLCVFFSSFYFILFISN